MGAYHYQALKKSGNTHKGVIEADSERHARQLLREKGLLPTQVFTAKKSPLKYRSKLLLRDLTLFTRELATLLGAGIPIEESLRGVSEQIEKSKTRQLIVGVRAKILEGFSLAQAMKEYPQAFPELYCATVAAGEQTGKLDTVLFKLADYLESQQQTRQKVQQALIYPALMIIISTVIISFLLAFVVPKIVDVFASSNQVLPQMTVILIFVSTWAKHYGAFTLFFLLIACMVFKKSLTYPYMRQIWDKCLLKLPLIRFLVQSLNVARYIHTFSILFTAGVSILETMRVSSSLLTNCMMQDAFTQAVIRVREGLSVQEALKETRFLSPMAINLIGSGERSGQLASMMERAAGHLDSEVKRLIDTGLTLFEPLIILIMGSIVLFIVLATLLPIFSMEQLVL